MNLVFRIANCNLQTGIGTTRGWWHYLATGWKYWFPHGSRPIERAAAFFRSAGIDVAALCEMSRGARRTKGIDQVSLLAEQSGLREQAFFPTLEVGDRVKQGNAICTRFPLRPMDNILLPGPGERRYLSEAELEIGGIRTRLLVTHLSLQPRVRVLQIEHIAGAVDSFAGPTILAGDFNVTQDGELELLAKSHLQKAISEPTFPSWRPKKYLDHLFLSEHFQVRGCYVYDEDLFSDHLPIIAEVELCPNGLETE